MISEGDKYHYQNILSVFDKFLVRKDRWQECKKES